MLAVKCVALVFLANIFACYGKDFQITISVSSGEDGKVHISQNSSREFRTGQNKTERHHRNVHVNRHGSNFSEDNPHGILTKNKDHSHVGGRRPYVAEKRGLQKHHSTVSNEDAKGSTQKSEDVKDMDNEIRAFILAIDEGVRLDTKKSSILQTILENLQ